MLLFDLNLFKRINDRFGHGVGDRVLMLFADLETGQAVAERIRSAFEMDGAVIAGGRVAPTVSVGVAVLSPTAFSLQQMIGHADLALYQAKASGRNCIRAIELEQGQEHGASVVVEAPPLKPELVSSRQPARGKAF